MYQNIKRFVYRNILIRERERERERRKEEEEERQPSVNAAVPPPTSSTSVELRTWSELPDLSLNSILTRLAASSPNLTDFLSFSSVCRSWRSLATTSSTSPTSFPPLLLLLPYHQNLRTLTLKTYTCTSPSLTLFLPCLGYSNGHLIFLDCGNPLLLNVFTGRVIVIGSPVPAAFLGFCLAFLTPSSNHLLLLDWNFRLFSYSPLTQSWSRLDLLHRITSISMFRDQVFGLDASAGLILFELDGAKISWKQMSEMPPLPGRYCMPCGGLGQSLVECGEELLMLRFVLGPYPCMKQMLQVYRMDFEKAAWIELDNIGDWCVFVDAVGACSLACPNPARWGGRSNCVYIAGPGCGNSWVVVQLDRSRKVGVWSDDVVSEELNNEDGYKLNLKLPLWPSPIWVYPSMLTHYK